MQRAPAQPDIALPTGTPNTQPPESPPPGAEDETVGGFDELTASWQTYRNEEWGFEVK